VTIDPRLIAFVGVAALLTILPGADMALVTRNVLAYGRRRTILTIVGISCGCVIHATASALGISAVLATSATAYNVMKTLGAAYLIWMGIQSIRSTRARVIPSEGHVIPSECEESAVLAGRPAPLKADTRSLATLGMTRSRAFSQGFLTNILNPKVAIFYLTFLPQFIAPGRNVLRQSLLLASIHIAMGFVWLTGYAWFVDRLGSVLTRPRVKARLERVTGGLLIALGARLAWEHR